MTEIFMVLAVVVIALVAYPFVRDYRIVSRPFPEEWRLIVEGRLPFFSKFTEPEKNELLKMIKLFVGKKIFYGCGGLEISDDIRITIAAEACLLLMNRNTDIYPGLRHILVYPHAFKAERSVSNQDGTISDMEHGLLGESWSSGKVILSWDDVASGVENFLDGHNVVLHEFSHQLDGESGATNGAPILRKNSYPVWAEVLSGEFQKLIEASDHHYERLADLFARNLG